MDLSTDGRDLLLGTLFVSARDVVDVHRQELLGVALDLTTYGANH